MSAPPEPVTRGRRPLALLLLALLASWPEMPLHRRPRGGSDAE